MTSQRLLKRIHVCGTLWFLLCAATLLFFSLWQAKIHWWLIFSISGYSAVLMFFIVTVYLFAIYQGVVRNQTTAEHPFSTSVYYIALYDLSPFLGTVAGLLCLSSYSNLASVLNTITQGTLATTFLVWTVFDPLIGTIETFLPASAAHRKQRLARVQQEKEAQKRKNEQLLHDLEHQEQQLQRQWQHLFAPLTEEIAPLLIEADVNESIKEKMVELGALAWETGGITCMRYFHGMILEKTRSLSQAPIIDVAAIWWDGIGTWRKPHSLEKLYLLEPAV